MAVCALAAAPLVTIHPAHVINCLYGELHALRRHRLGPGRTWDQQQIVQCAQAASHFHKQAADSCFWPEPSCLCQALACISLFSTPAMRCCL